MSQPYSAETERAAYAAEVADGCVLTPGIVAHCESGIAMTFAVADPDAGAIPGVGLAWRSVQGGRVRFIIRRSSNDRALLALMRDGRIATTCTLPTTHRSIQIKGRDAVVGAVGPADLKAATTQSRIFRDLLADLGYERHLVDLYGAFDPTDLAAIEFTPETVFAQTPGPGAGSALSGSSPG